MEATSDYIQAVELIRKNIPRRRKYTVAIDGIDHSGKSTFARYLAWQLDMSVIELDLCRKFNVCPIETDLDILAHLIEARQKITRPVVVEGILVLGVLNTIGVEVDFLVRMRNQNFKRDSRFKERFLAYEKNYLAAREPDFEITCSLCGP